MRSEVLMGEGDGRRANSVRPATDDINPLGKTRSVLALNVNDVSVTPASAAHAVLLLLVPVLPVVVLLEARLLVQRCRLEVGLARQLPRGRVGRAVLDGRVSVAKVAEVVHVLGAEENTGREGVDRRVSPLHLLALARLSCCETKKHTLSIQKPPLRSIIWKKSLYSLLRNQLNLAISKLDQKWHMLYFSASIASPSMLGRVLLLGSARSTSSGSDWSCFGGSCALVSIGSTNISQRPWDLML